jgi:hypothetical protein
MHYPLRDACQIIQDAILDDLALVKTAMRRLCRRTLDFPNKKAGLNPAFSRSLS